MQRRLFTPVSEEPRGTTIEHGLTVALVIVVIVALLQIAGLRF